MKKLPDTIATVHLDSIGERTKSRWVGQFKIKRVLSHADQFALERMYAALLPSRDREISEDVRLRAAAIAELYVRVLEGPEWWNGTRYGQQMVDTDPLYDLVGLCSDEEKKWSEQLEAEAKFEDTNAVDPEKPA